MTLRLLERVVCVGDTDVVGESVVYVGDTEVVGETLLESGLCR